MESIKAIIQGDDVNGSVEFSVEEVIARHQGKPWEEMSDGEIEAAMKDYALELFARQDGVTSDLQVTLESGTFSNVEDGEI